MARSVDERIDELEKAVERLTEQMKHFDNNAKSSADSIGKTNNLLGEALGSMKQIGVESAKFARSLNKQYQWAEKLAEVSKQTAVNIGLSVGRSAQFTKEFNKATAAVQKFGGDATDVSNIIERMTDKSGRARIITEEEVLNVYLLEKGLGIADETASEMMERMDQMGINAVSANDAIQDMVVESQKLGLNASKVGKALANNFEKMQTFSFKGGVKGMTEMAKLAVQMRTDVSSMLGMAEKFYEPEQAIEAVANLQMLGGDVAQAFGDPFEVMYLARNKPEELAKKVQDMTSEMIQFNEETGEYDLPAEGRMQLQAMGEQLGFNVDQMVDMARQSSKIKDIKMNVSGNILDEDMREGVASLARMDENGKWVVDMEGAGAIPVEDLNMDEAEKLLSAPKDADEAIMDMATNSMTTNEILSNIEKSIKTGIVAEVNVYEALEDTIRPSIEAMMEGTRDTVDRLVKHQQEGPVGDYRKHLQRQYEKLGKDGEEVIDSLFKDLEKVMDENLENLKRAFDVDKINDLFNKLYAGENADPDKTGEGGGPNPDNDFLSRNTGGVTSFVSQDDVLGAKRGGVIDKLLDSALGNGRGGNLGNGNITLNGEIKVTGPAGAIASINASELRKMVINQINQTERNGGTTSGKQMIDNGSLNA